MAQLPERFIPDAVLSAGVPMVLHALAYAAQGWRVFPCRPDTKAPYTPSGFRDASLDELTIIGWWTRWPAAMIGLPTGASAGTWALDLDVHHADHDGRTWLAEMEARHGHLPVMPRARTASGGEHLFFRYDPSDPVTNRRGGLPAGVDVRGDGGYVVLAPSVRADGTVYAWTIAPEEADFPDAPEWLLEILRPPAATARPQSAPHDRPPRHTGRSPYAEEALRRECEIVASAASGTRNDTINTAGFNLGQLVPHLLAESDVIAALEAAARAWGVNPKDKVFGPKGTIARAVSAGMAAPRQPPEIYQQDDELTERGAAITRQLLRSDDGTFYDADTGEVVTPEQADGAREDRDCPDDLLTAPGLVGEIADWVLATSPRPSRLFALASGLSAVGALAARRYYTGTPRSGTNLYMMIIAETGGGKDWPQQSVGQVIAAAGAAEMVAGPLSSSAALSVRLADRPAMLQIIDEMDSLFAQASAKGASTQELNLVRDLCTVWGRSAGQWIPQSTTSRAIEVIERPTLAIYGGTTPGAFFRHLRSEMISNGFLNRFLVLPVYSRPKRKRDMAVQEVPEHIVARAKSILSYPPTGGNMPVMNFSRLPPPQVDVPFSAAAQAAYFAFEDEIDAFIDGHPGDDLAADVKKRLPDMAKRIALVVAIGRHVDDLSRMEVSAEDFAFGRRLTEWSAEQLIRGIEENFAANEHQANVNLVLGFIRTSGTITQMELYRKIHGKLDARTIASIIEQLLKSELIEGGSVESTSGRGRKAKAYRYVG